MPGFNRSVAWVVAVGSIFFILAVILPKFFEFSYSAPLSLVRSQVAEVQEVLVSHIATPEPLKAIYMTACVASTSTWRDSLKKLIERTELNAIVVDIKDYSGEVSFANDFPKSLTPRGCVVSDMREFIQALHEAQIYVIGRVSVFQDPSYTKLFPALAVKRKSDGAVWKDFKGLSFIDVGAKPYWDYIINISKKSYELGFDEINYDYVRYPSDGNIADAHFSWTVGTSTKPMMLKSFFEYLADGMKNTDVKRSVDLFGMTTTVESDMNIGQVLENALPYFDYVSPMVYPSHYPPSWNGFANPADNPYQVIKISMSSAVAREQIWDITQNIATSTPSKMRPWLQDFNLGATYGSDKIRAQIQATYDVGLTSWMLWNAGNKYTAAALLPEQRDALQTQ